MTDSPASSSLQTRLTHTFPQTSGLTREDLQALLGETPLPYHPQHASTDSGQDQRAADAAYFEAFFHSLPQAQQLYAQHAALLRTNEEKAQKNTQLQKPLEELRTETQQLFDRAKSLEAELPRLEKQMNDEYRRFAPSALHFSLTQSASKLNDRSEDLANAYVEGLPYPTDESGTAPEAMLDDVSFVRRYKAQRTLYHKRRIVADRWARGQVHWTD
ncbi:hypothetical protein BCV70DRAFT_15397 [Testicularia cyperi]|uniref:VPS37 C-terminal domain-containing protein n=1 Tax=Testicularia cyperi TaxID=1882483 RepID=A0A317XYF7_9BASI|nr:hypothetical protein BCV70DRAFT_15397 [Testicularia cyperi]